MTRDLRGGNAASNSSATTVSNDATSHHINLLFPAFSPFWYMFRYQELPRLHKRFVRQKMLYFPAFTFWGCHHDHSYSQPISGWIRTVRILISGWCS